MLSREDNDLLTRVEGDAPMGRLLRRHYWLPFLRAAKLKADGPPERVRLLGENFVAFRGTDGSIGFLDEACPHRGASLLLGRNENCALQCVFHGWRISTAGKVVEVPNESNDPEGFAARVPVRSFSTREAGGLLWVWLGEEGEPPPFPDFEFTQVPDDQIFVCYTPVACNWLQGVDATVDSAHVGILHQSWVGAIKGRPGQMISGNLAPRYEVQDRPYGLTAVALRDLEDGSTYARIGEFVAPFFMFLGTSNSAAGECALFINVPVDDYNSFLVLLRYTLPGKGPITTGPGFDWDPEGVDLDNFATIPSDGWIRWGQNRDAMDRGHFTGYEGNLLMEDVAVQISMGPIVNRAKEFLSTSDIGIARARRMLLRLVRNFDEGRSPAKDIDYGTIRADAVVMPPGQRWQDL